jgi:hypothetical protein
MIQIIIIILSLLCLIFNGLAAYYYEDNRTVYIISLVIWTITATLNVLIYLNGLKGI